MATEQLRATARTSPLIEPLRIKDKGSSNTAVLGPSHLSASGPYPPSSSSRGIRQQHKDQDTFNSAHLTVSTPSSYKHHHHHHHSSSSYSTSPLFDHVQNTSRSASSHDSDSSSSFARSPLPADKMDKTLPELPIHAADDSTYSNGSHEKENHVLYHPSTSNDGHLKYQHEQGNSALHGLGMNGTSITSDGATELSSNWVNRKAAMKAASQSAGAGIKKFGKASAARIKQTQLMPPKTRDGASPLIGALSPGLWRSDGRTHKSAVDPSTNSTQNDNLSPLPNATPDPNIGLPTDVKHNVHVDVGPYGYIGLPMSWAHILTQQGISGEELQRNPNLAMKVLQSNLEYQDMDKTSSILSKHTDGNGKSTKQGPPKRLSTPETSYSSIAETSWPSPIWSESGTAPSFSLVGADSHDSPSLPEVQADEDDWASSLLRSIPASESGRHLFDQTNKRRSRSFEFAPVSSTAKNVERNESMTEDVEQEEHLQGSPSENGDGSYDEENEGMPAIATAIKGYTGTAKLYRPSQLGPASQIRRDSRDSATNRRKSAASMSQSTSTHSQHEQPRVSSSPSFGHNASPSGSSYGDASSAFHTTIHGSSSPVLALSGPPSPSRDKSIPSNASDSSNHTPIGLRERRKASPRIYPPSSVKFIPKEDNLSPYTAHGFRRSSSGMGSDSIYKAVSASSNNSQMEVKEQVHERLPTPLSPSDFSRDNHSSSSHSSSALHTTALLRRKFESDHTGQASSVEINNYSFTSKGSSSVDRREEILDGPPLPPKTARVPPGQAAPDFILPGRDGFYSAPPSSSIAETHSNSFAIAGRNPSHPITRDVQPTLSISSLESQGLSPAPSPLYSAFSRQRDTSPQLFESPLVSPLVVRSSNSPPEPIQNPTVVEDGESQHDAADFIEDWLKNDDDTAALSDSPGSANDSPRYFQSTPASHRPSLRLAFPRQTSSSQHQSPSPALLQGLPTLQNGLEVISSQLTPPLAIVKQSKTTIDSARHWQQEKGEKDTITLEPGLEPSREGRVRSLPPAPSIDAYQGRQESESKEGPAGDRVSVSSLPSESDSWLRMDSSDPGSPSADADAYETAAYLSRPNSRSSSHQSRSSSRAGARRITRTPRRSIDARKFPVSMHYPNGFEPDVLDLDARRDSQHSVKFAEMARARQSLDLDDVMPLSMVEAGQSLIPPVPPLPGKVALENQQINSSLQLRAEKPTEIFSDLVIIGEGDSGNVYSTIPHFDCTIPSVKGRGKVAVKVVDFTSKADDKSAGRTRTLDREISYWRQSHLHDNIVTLYDVFISPEEDDHPGVWIVQEFMSMSLADLIGLKASGVNITEPHMARIMLDGVSALEHLHHLDVIHRDVRSDNLLLTFDGVAKLTDFTHATRLEECTEENGVVGTAYWMAPEVVKAEYYTSKVDIWNLGVVLYEMVEGDPPRIDFPALRAITLTAKLGLPPLSQPGLFSSELRHCLAWCTEMDPEKRPSASLLAHSEFLSLHTSHQLVADLMEDARIIEANDGVIEEETMNDSTPIEEAIYTNKADMRDSWNSQSTVHAV